MKATESVPPSRARRHPKANATTRYGNGVGQGDSWGGPAKGPGRGSPALLIPGLSHAKPESAEARRQTKVERAKALEDQLFYLSMNADREETKVAACVKLHAIYMGQPMQKTVNVQEDDLSRYTDEELADMIADLDRKLKLEHSFEPLRED